MKGRRAIILSAAITALWSTAPAAVSGSHQAKAPYAGQQTRSVTSFSQTEIDDLVAGKGMGLAKPAELNGYPGPLHVLELADKLALSAEQLKSVQSQYALMKAKAQNLGKELINAERAVDDVFRSKGPTIALIKARLTAAARIRARLRMSHLAAHLQTASVLTRHQTMLYSKLRGYTGAADHRMHNH